VNDADIHDTYFALLETPGPRELEQASVPLPYRTRAFSPDTYARAAGIDFPDEVDAYRHWLEYGRRQGLEWAPGKDTLLKIILKAKDEPYLIDAWVAHHAAIVGFENIVILDCGSTDPGYLRKLAGHARRVLVLPYRSYYDDVHWVHGSRGFYELIARNCRYATILDADEFLIGRDGAYFSSRLVRSVLRRHDLPLHCGTWVNAVDGPALDGGELPIEWGLDASVGALTHGTHAGKATMRTDVLLQAGHLGHNFHLADVARLATPDSLGQLLVLHVKNLPPAEMQRRILQHLLSRRLVASPLDGKPLAEIAMLVDKPDVGPLEQLYARNYLELETTPWPRRDESLPRAALVGDQPPRLVPDLAAALDAVDFPEQLQRWRRDLNLADHE
jgi:hypothetical protein